MSTTLHAADRPARVHIDGQSHHTTLSATETRDGASYSFWSRVDCYPARPAGQQWEMRTWVTREGHLSEVVEIPFQERPTVDRFRSTHQWVTDYYNRAVFWAPGGLALYPIKH